jgi:hypothetical protein
MDVIDEAVKGSKEAVKMTHFNFLCRSRSLCLLYNERLRILKLGHKHPQGISRRGQENGDVGRLIPPFSVSRLHAAKRRSVEICKIKKHHDRSSPQHQRRTSRGHSEKPAKEYVARTTRWDRSVRYK